jgi:hypothetical protein
VSKAYKAFKVPSVFKGRQVLKGPPELRVLRAYKASKVFKALTAPKV